MASIDCFNGDADGICALIQLRLNEPMRARRVTGVKRDIQLLAKVHAGKGDTVTVLDISLDKNRADLMRILEAGAQVFYCDHHYMGALPQHANFTGLIRTASNVCTSLLINQKLQGRYALWALVGMFGDNLYHFAVSLAQKMQLSDIDIQALKRLGVCLNYNGYGACLDELHFHPESLFSQLLEFDNPLNFLAQDTQILPRLESAYREDIRASRAIAPIHDSPSCLVYILPDAIWARRISGVFANTLANASPEKAHAILTERKGGYSVSVRAPLNNKRNADSVCRQFDTGGGRAAAAGINCLPSEELSRLIDCLERYYH